METYNGHVRTPQDAIVLFEACRLGLLPRVQRRLSEKERQLIKSGSVFVWDEREAGMRRWTDGKSWSASRVSGSFLCYREMEGKRGGGDFSSAPASGRGGSGSEGKEDDAADKPDGYRYKPDGLVKQSFSITTSNGQHLHLISYYARSHPAAATLKQPSQDPMFRHIRPAKGLYPESSIVEAPTGSAGARSPMPITQYTASPQQQIMSGQGPAYARPPPHSQGHNVGPGYSWPASPAIATPNSIHYSPYPQQNGGQRLGSAQTSPQYYNQLAYNPHQQRDTGPTAFDRAPPPMTSGGLPPPPPPGQTSMNHHGPPMQPYGHPLSNPLQHAHPGSAPPYNQQSQPYNYRPPSPSSAIDPRLNPPTSSYRDNLPTPPSYMSGHSDYRNGPPTQAGNNSTNYGPDYRNSGPPMTLPPPSTIPSITSLIHNPPSAPAVRRGSNPSQNSYGYQSSSDAHQQGSLSNNLPSQNRMNGATSDAPQQGGYYPARSPRHPGYQPPGNQYQNGSGGSISPHEKPANGERIPGIATAVAAAGKGAASGGFREDARALRQLDRAFAP